MDIVKFCEAALIAAFTLLTPAHVQDPRPAAVVTSAAGAVTTKRPIGTAYAYAGYIEHLPAGYGHGPKSPLLISFHGRGEGGPGTLQSLEAIKRDGPPRLIERGQWNQPFVMLAPQHIGDSCPSAVEVDRFVKFAKAHYHVDPSRVYLAGLSCGARGIAEYFAHFGAGEIAATVLLSGDISPAWAKYECKLNVPIFASHNEDDDMVFASGDMASYERMRDECPNRADVHFVHRPTGGHDAWTATYDGTAGVNVFDWLLKYRRARPVHSATR